MANLEKKKAHTNREIQKKKLKIAFYENIYHIGSLKNSTYMWSAEMLCFFSPDTRNARKHSPYYSAG